jgi:hypothetical protein
MSAESDYISSEAKNVLQTAKLIEGLLEKRAHKIRSNRTRETIAGCLYGS